MTTRVDSLGDALVRMIQHIAKEAAREAVSKTPLDQLADAVERKTGKALPGRQQYFSAREVADRLGVDPNAVYMRQSRRKLPRGKMKLADVLAWEQERAGSPSGKYAHSRYSSKLNGSSRARVV